MQRSVCTASQITIRSIITRIWSGASLLYLLLLPFSWIYGLVTALIRFSYRCGLKKTHRFPVPIVVVGNLTAGGSGKTPVVLWLVMQLQARNWRVGVVSRGYGGNAANYPLILNADTSSNHCGDEPLIIWQRTGAPVAVAPRRSEAVAALLRIYNLDVVVADDGLQHYALGQDIKWVVIDGERRFGNGWLLPAGPMRERSKCLKQVQAIIVNGGYPEPGEIPMRLIAGKAVNLLTGEPCSLNNLKIIVAMAGIGYPPRFFATIRSCGVHPAREIIFSDHKMYQPHMINALVSPEENLLMTEKDAVKCKSFARINWWYLPVYAQLPENAQQTLINSVEQTILYYRCRKTLINFNESNI